jgi:PBP1b-binding outer membrane lipoprotein LpoB
MKILFSALTAAWLLSGCISSSSPPPPAKTTTVIVPQNSGTTVVCQDGTKPPCN